MHLILEARQYSFWNKGAVHGHSMGHTQHAQLKPQAETKTNDGKSSNETFKYILEWNFVEYKKDYSHTINLLVLYNIQTWISSNLCNENSAVSRNNVCSVLSASRYRNQALIPRQHHNLHININTLMPEQNGCHFLFLKRKCLKFHRNFTDMYCWGFRKLKHNFDLRYDVVQSDNKPLA